MGTKENTSFWFFRLRPSKTFGGKTLKKKYMFKLLWSTAIVLATAALWLLTRDGLTALYWIICNALIDTWGVTSKNLYRAPGFVRVMTSYGTLIATGLGAVILLIMTRIFKRRLVNLPANGCAVKRHTGRGVAVGTILVASLWLVYVLTGTMRVTLSTTINQLGTIGYGAILLLIGLLQLGAQSSLAYGVVYPLLKKQLGRWAALGILMALMLLATAWDDSTRVIWLLNAALMTAVCYFSCEKYENISWIVGFRTAFLALDMLLGFPNANGVLCETYLVNSSWLNGGSSGIMAGLGMTTALIFLLIPHIIALHKSFSWPLHRRSECRVTRK